MESIPYQINLDDYSSAADFDKTIKKNKLFFHADCNARQETAGTQPQLSKESSTINYIKKAHIWVVA